MELENRTPYPAKLFRNALKNDRLAAAVLARVTFELTPRGPIPAEDQPWIVSPAPWENDYGAMTGDEVFIRDGIDIFLFGHAWAPSGGSTTRQEVTIAVGESFLRRIWVFGERRWVRKDRDFAATSPARFESIPLTLANAFGGKDEWDGLEIAFPNNPEGKGYSYDESRVEGRRLPNIEDPTRLIQRWNDMPDPVGVEMCPITSGLRLRNGITLDDEYRIRAIKPSFWNSAFPEMIARRVLPGDGVRLTGVHPYGPISFRLPDFRLLLRLRFGTETIERPLAIDQVGFEPDRARVFITYRYSFRYVVYPLQKRSCELLPASETAAAR